MLTNKNLVYKELKLTSKLEVLESIGNKLVENKIIDDKTELVEAFIEREKQFSTGIGEGIAIPHAEISGIEEPQVVVVGLKDIDWESMDGSPVKTAVGIIVPKGGRGDHMTIIAELSKKMVDGDFLNILKSGTEEDVVNLINDIKLNTEEASETKESKTDNKDSKYIIGITACPTGIAHTFMAQQKLMDAAKELGYEVKIETQGSDGQKNALTVEDIRRADGIVIASAIQLSGMERFDGYEDKMLKIPVAQAIKDNFGSISTAMEMAKQFNSDPEKVKKAEAKSNVTFADEKESWVKVVVGHTMSGISAMILLLSLTGLLLAVGNIGALPWTLNSDVSKWIGDAYWATYNNWWVNLMYYMAQMGSLLMKFIYPIFAMYCAYSIGGRLALMPGFFGGMMAGGLESYFINDGIYTSNLLGWAYPNGFIPSMFFGALFIGFFAGYCVKFLNNKIQVSPNFISLKTMLIVPFAMSMIVFIVMAFAINPLFGLINWGMSEFFRAAGTSGALVYHASISAGMAFDLGGPVNKAANALATSSAQSALDGLQVAYTDWVDAGRLTSGVEYDAVQAAADNMLVFNSTSRSIAIVTAPIGLGIAALTGNRITGRQIFTSEDQQLGIQSTSLGVIGLSEGGIPFMIRYPLYAITADVIGGMVGGVIGAVVFKACGTIPIAAIWGWFLTGTTTSGFEMFGIPSIGVQITGHVVGVILGSLTTAAIFISFLLIKDIRENKQNRIVNVNKQEEISKEEITNSIEAIDRVNKYLENVKVEYGDSNLKAHDEEKLKSLDGMVINFSKLKSTVGNETKIVPKLNYIIMRSGQKINILNDQLQKLTDNKEKEVSIKDKINGLEETIKQNEILLKESKQNISKEINSIIMYLDGYKKELNKYGK